MGAFPLAEVVLKLVGIEIALFFGFLFGLTLPPNYLSSSDNTRAVKAIEAVIGNMNQRGVEGNIQEVLEVFTFGKISFLKQFSMEESGCCRLFVQCLRHKYR